MNRRFLALAAAAALLSASGCAPALPADTLRMAQTVIPRSLDPADNYASWDLMRFGVGECLARFDEKMTPLPWLAESWSADPSRTVWTFRIRNGVFFSNGRPLTAEAVRASLLRVFARSPRARSFFTPKAIEADGQRLVIRTEAPAPNLPGLLADPLFLVIDTEASGDIRRRGPVGTGPYRLDEADSAVFHFSANPYRAVPFRRLDVVFVPDPGASSMALQAGETDVLPNAAPESLPLFRGGPYRVSETASLRAVLARFNAAPGRPLEDRRVRAALISACDRKTWCEILLGGAFIPGGPALPPSMDCGFNALRDPNGYDPERAKRLLDEAGWTDTDGDGIREKDGQKLTMDFVYYSSRAELPIFAEATQADAKKVGIDIKLQSVDYNVLDGMAKRGEYDLIISNILTANTGDPEVYLNWYWKTNVDGSNPQNGSGYSNAEYDALSDQLAAEFDPARRRELMIRMQQILLDDGATLIFGYPKTNMVSSTRVTGARILPADYYWITKDIKPAEG